MENKTNPNDYAFPLDGYSAGLTKREYFAAKTLQGLIWAGDYANLSHKAIASDAVLIADALITELNKEVK